MQRLPQNLQLLRILFVIFFFFLFGCSSRSEPTDPKLSFKNTVVSLTFDDGDKDNISVRADLSRNKLHATFYIVSSFIGTDGYMSETDLHALYADDNEIGGHTYSHASLNDLRGGDLKFQICQDRT